MTKAKANAAPVVVMIPTMDRPDSLARALRSVFAQDRADLIHEIAVIDNAPDASARAVVDSLRAASPAPIVYLHAQPPGVATARNMGVAHTQSPYVAFIDDDEEAATSWLGRLYDTHRSMDADVTFGPVQGRAEGAAPWKRAYLDRFFSRTGPETSGLTDLVFGCGNSMMTRARALNAQPPFDLASDQTGGEDDRLFARLKAEGARFAWAADALVEEHAPQHRVRLRYTFVRTIAYGQSPTKLCLRRGDRLGAAKWIAVGVVQGVGYGLCAIIFLAIGRPRWLDMVKASAGGFGKMLWFAPLHFYGQAAANKPPARAASCEETLEARPAHG